MAQCPACKRKISDRYTYCINCGLNFVEIEKLDFMISQMRTLRDTKIVSEEQKQKITQIYENRKKEILKKHSPKTPVVKDKPTPPKTKADYPQATSFQISAFLENFSISWLLYLGAFLVSVAAIIFTAYKWQEFSPYIKLIILLGFTGTLYGFGQYSLAVLKLRKAGLTLIGLGLFMLPIILYGMNANTKTAAWPQFWLFNSVFTITIFAFGAVYYKSKLFAWVSVFPILITTWSFSKIFNTPFEGSAFYYVLTAIVLLLLTNIKEDRFKWLYQGLLLISAYSVAITALALSSFSLNPILNFGREYLATQFLLYLFGTIFFAISSIREKEISPLITVGLVYFAAGHAGAIYHFKLVHQFYLAILLSLAFNSLSFIKNYINSYKKATKFVSLFVAIAASFVLSIFWLVNFLKTAGIEDFLPFSSTNIMALLLIAALYFFLSSINIHQGFLYLTALLVPLAASIAPTIFNAHISVVAYIIIGFSVAYLLSTLYKKNEYTDILFNSSLFLAVIAGFCSFADNTGATIVWIIASTVFGLASYFSKNKSLVFGALISSFIAYSFGFVVFDFKFDVEYMGWVYMPYWSLVFLIGLRFYFWKDRYLSTVFFATNALLSFVFMQITFSTGAPHSVIWKLALFYGFFVVCMALLYENLYYAAVGFVLLTGSIGYAFSAYGAQKIVIAYAVLLSSLLWYGITYLRLVFKPFQKIREGILGAVVFAAVVPPFFFEPGKQFTFLLLSAGIVFGFYFAIERKERFAHLAATFLIGSLDLYMYYWQKVQVAEYYTIPWAFYFIVVGLIYLRLPEQKVFEDMPSRAELAQLALWGGSLSMFVPPLFLSFEESFPHAWIIFVLAPLIVVLGIQHRVKALIFVAGTGIVLEGLLQIAEPLMSLPKWVSLGGVGLGLISSAVFFERNRNKVVELTKNTVQLLKEWN